MSPARIPPLTPPYPAEIAAELTAMMPPGIEPLKLFRTLAHNPRVLRKFHLGNLLDRGAIDRRDREIVILRTCARCGSEYEWGVHVTVFAARVGLTTEQVAATVDGSADHPAWSEADALLIRLADELHDNATIAPALWNAMAERWSPAQLIELLVVAGFYHTVSFVTNAVAIDLEEMAARFA
jgi:alkylhydroperoxidase family enzyme